MKKYIALLGFLRTGLIGLAIINTFFSMIYLLWYKQDELLETNAVWDAFASVVSPVMAPLFVVVLFLDYIMSRVRAVDAEGELLTRYIQISRIELFVIVITLAYWLPYISALVR